MIYFLNVFNDYLDAINLNTEFGQFFMGIIAIVIIIVIAGYLKADFTTLLLIMAFIMSIFVALGVFPNYIIFIMFITIIILIFFKVRVII